MSDNLDSVLLRFRSAATKFIETVDSAPHLQREEFLSGLNHCLAELYSSALYLPVGVPNTEDFDGTPFETEEWAGLFNSLKDKIGPQDAYWEIFDSTKKDDPVQGSLAADISEIYFDLKQGLTFEPKGKSQKDLIWELRFSFRSHWGKHLLGALTAIHDLRVA